MADPLIGATVKLLLENVVSLATDDIGLVFKFKKDVKKLRNSLDMIQAVLADAEKKQYQHESVKLWLQNLQEVAYEAGDVFDTLNYQLLKRRVESAAENPRKVKVFSNFSSSSIPHWKMARKVRNINLKLKAINVEATGFGLQSQLVASGSNSTIYAPGLEVPSMSRETDSIVDQNVVGRDDDASNIVQNLLSPSTENVSFIPITGMGGLGKTTLAKLVYNDAKIEEYFDKKIWICVSDNFDVTRVFKLILESLQRGTVDLVSRDVIVQEIKIELYGKRYLLVLDDVWCQNPAIWGDFLRSLVGICTAKGNWGLVTTRQQEVASIVTTNNPFTLGKLSDDGCWTIFKEKASPIGEVTKELDAVKAEIIGACKGLPLAASVIGGLLRIESQHQWLSIVRNEISNLTGDVQQILRLSFDHLPSASIKKCFAYCSMFEKDSDMEKDMLIQLWMAEGFLQPDHGNKLDMEVIGSRYFDVLVKSSLIEKSTKKGHVIGRIQEVVVGRMHDLVHDLAQTVSESKTISDSVEPEARNHQCGVRHVVLESLSENILSMLRERSSSLRTIFIKCDGVPKDLVLNFKCLHVLKLSGSSGYKQLLDSVSKLIHLRYFDLSYPDVDALPESLCKLYNLQTLRLVKCRDLRKLPEGMSNLVSLRHLHFYSGNEELKMPSRMRNLTCLQTLEFFNVGEEDGWKIEEIGWLTKLGGRLSIRNLEKVNGKEEALKAKLSSKSYLVVLTFEWARGRDINNNNINEGQVLEGLKPHPNLQELSVSEFMGSRFPSWITRLNNLVELSLNHCNGCDEIPALGQLPLLKNLSLSGMNSIICIGVAFYGTEGNCRRESFPALRGLRLEGLLNLVDWMEAEKKKLASGEEAVLRVFPRLQKLVISRCKLLRSIPSHFPCLEDLTIHDACSNCDLILSSICNKLNTLTNLTVHSKSLTCVPDVVFINNSKTLKSLSLQNCYNLTHISRFSLSTCENLERLYTRGCLNLKSVFISSGHQLPSSLRTFQIFKSIQLRSLPDELFRSCTSLQNLWVHDCSNLVSFPVDLQYHPSLRSLDLIRNPELITMPTGFSRCNSLVSLMIGPFSDSLTFDWPDLSSSSVRHLVLYGETDSVSLPDQLRCLTSITELSLSDFGSLESLPDWLENLVSLQKLILFQCPKLTHLPSAEAMRCLTNLRALVIYDCPILMERCTPSNPEWSKISHISQIGIIYRRIK